MPLPDRGFDPTEAAVPWRLLTQAGNDVVFATEQGGVAPAADPIALEGFVFGQFGADAEPKRFYTELERDPSFVRPHSWEMLDAGSFDGSCSPAGMRRA
jgi:putative intracellular protease/amidase